MLSKSSQHKVVDFGWR